MTEVDPNSPSTNIWEHPALTLDPVAPDTGPFPRPNFLRTMTSVDEEEVLLLGDSSSGAMVLTWRSGVLEMAGHPDYCDYHSPLGEGSSDLLAAFLSETKAGTQVSLDSLPQEAVPVVEAGLVGGGIDLSTRVHHASQVLDLPGSFDDYLGSLDKKQRHEARRKLRRFEGAVGELRLETHQGAGWGFEEFLRLHRLASGEKGRFMDDRNHRRFATLAEDSAWSTSLLRAGDRVAAALFGAEDSGVYYLYNSAYDPLLSEFSPGLVAVLIAIKEAILRGKRSFDFLKGDEPYKSRLGAIPRLLYVVGGVK